MLTLKLPTAVVAAALMPSSVVEREVLLSPGTPLIRADLLVPGTQRYLRYFVKDGHRRPLDIWSRTISFEIRGGRRLVRVRQQWDGGGSAPTSRIEDSYLEPGTFTPVFHSRSRTSADGTVHDAFRFDGGTVIGDPEVADNVSRSYRQVTAAAPYNFVVDLEWFRQLPMALGRVFVASLLDPPGGKPDTYRFTVAGSARVAGPDGRMIDSWMVTTDYNQPGRPLSRYWFAKSNQFLLRQESDAGDRGTLVKMLLGSEAGDASG